MVHRNTYISFVMVPGMAVDYVAHLADAYLDDPEHGDKWTESRRARRMKRMLGEVGVSVISGACSTLGATFFLFFPTVRITLAIKHICTAILEYL